MEGGWDSEAWTASWSCHFPAQDLGTDECFVSFPIWKRKWTRWFFLKNFFFFNKKKIKPWTVCSNKILPEAQTGSLRVKVSLHYNGWSPAYTLPEPWGILCLSMVSETIELDLHFSPCRQSQGILLKCRFWFGRPGRGLGLCISNKVPGDADVAGPQHVGNCKDNDSLCSLQSAFWVEEKHWTLTLLGSPHTFMETSVWLGQPFHI